MSLSIHEQRIGPAGGAFEDADEGIAIGPLHRIGRERDGQRG